QSGCGKALGLHAVDRPDEPAHQQPHVPVDAGRPRPRDARVEPLVMSEGRASGATVREATAADKSAVTAMLARAFWDDPLTSHLLADVSTRGTKLPRMFGLLMKLAL